MRSNYPRERKNGSNFGGFPWPRRSPYHEDGSVVSRALHANYTCSQHFNKIKSNYFNGEGRGDSCAALHRLTRGRNIERFPRIIELSSERLMRGHGSLFNLPKYRLRMWFDVLFRLTVRGWFRSQFFREVECVQEMKNSMYHYVNWVFSRELQCECCLFIR